MLKHVEISSEFRLTLIWIRCCTQCAKLYVPMFSPVCHLWPKFPKGIAESQLMNTNGKQHCCVFRKWDFRSVLLFPTLLLFAHWPVVNNLQCCIYVPYLPSCLSVYVSSPLYSFTTSHSIPSPPPLSALSTLEIHKLEVKLFISANSYTPQTFSTCQHAGKMNKDAHKSSCMKC